MIDLFADGIGQVIDLLTIWVLPILLVLGALVFFHELGHYSVARWCGVRIEAFSIGFGREVVGWNDKAGTRWRIALLPLGGYVKFAGDENAASAPGSNFDPDDPSIFHNKPLWQRAAVVFAGPAANFILAVVIFVGLFTALGQPYTPARINTVQPDSAAFEAGLQPGDLIVEANGERIDDFADLKRIVAINLDRPLSLLVERDGQVIARDMTPRIVEEDDGFGRTSRAGRIGVTVTSDGAYRQVGLGGAVVESVERVWETVTASLTAVGDMVVGNRSVNELRGPPGIAEVVGEVAQLGIVPLINLAAFLSISLGLINLFPIPMLDGGHLLFYAVEAVRGRPLSESAQEIGYRIGLALVVGLMVLVTVNDIGHFGLFDQVQNLFS